jgi:exodeoxyribonuclease VII large subunit
MRAAIRALPTAEILLALPHQRLDHAAGRLPRALIANAQVHHRQFSRVSGRLGPQLLRARIARCCEFTSSLADRARRAEIVLQQRRRERLSVATLRLQAGLRANAEAQRARLARARERIFALSDRAQRAVQTLLREHAVGLHRCGQLLAALSYRGVLARGFALVHDLDGKTLRTVAAMKAGLAVDIEFSDGRARAQVEGSSRPPASEPQAGPGGGAKWRARRGGGDSGQGSLFGA